MSVPSLRTLIAGSEMVLAPFVFDPLSAKVAEETGFKALYLGGGGLGNMKVVTEANLTVTEMCQTGAEIAGVCPLPLILDGAGGWGDPMHIRRTIALAERAGFSAIEIEDQLLPKRAHHHVGLEHLVPQEMIVAKIAVAAQSRRSPDFLIIARTNAGRHDLDDALRRAEACKAAGADLIFMFPVLPEHMRALAERVPGPFMAMIPPGSSAAKLGISAAEMAALGFRLLVDPLTPMIGVYHALRGAYASIRRGVPDPAVADARAETEAMMKTINLEALLEIERRTVEPDAVLPADAGARA